MGGCSWGGRMRRRGWRVLDKIAALRAAAETREFMRSSCPSTGTDKHALDFYCSRGAEPAAVMFFAFRKRDDESGPGNIDCERGQIYFLCNHENRSVPFNPSESRLRDQHIVVSHSGLVHDCAWASLGDCAIGRLENQATVRVDTQLILNRFEPQ